MMTTSFNVDEFVSFHEPGEVTPSPSPVEEIVTKARKKRPASPVVIESDLELSPRYSSPLAANTLLEISRVPPSGPWLSSRRRRSSSPTGTSKESPIVVIDSPPLSSLATTSPPSLLSRESLTVTPSIGCSERLLFASQLYKSPFGEIRRVTKELTPEPQPEDYSPPEDPYSPVLQLSIRSSPWNRNFSLVLKDMRHFLSDWIENAEKYDIDFIIARKEIRDPRKRRERIEYLRTTIPNPAQILSTALDWLIWYWQFYREETKTEFNAIQWKTLPITALVLSVKYFEDIGGTLLPYFLAKDAYRMFGDVELKNYLKSENELYSFLQSHFEFFGATGVLLERFDSCFEDLLQQTASIIAPEILYDKILERLNRALNNSSEARFLWSMSPVDRILRLSLKVIQNDPSL